LGILLLLNGSLIDFRVFRGFIGMILDQVTPESIGSTKGVLTAFKGTLEGTVG
jgi:hypothetical protein